MPPTTMRAVRYHEYGPAQVLKVDRIPPPEPKTGEVLIRVHAAGVNPVDWKFRSGNYRNPNSPPLPQTPGLDLAGTVEALGPGVTGFQKGQAVFGRGSGAYADYAIASATTLGPKPKNLSFDEAGTLAVGAVTAWVGLFTVGGLQKGQRVLVHGGAGGVGLWGVQFAKWKGAHVTATASGSNVDYVKSLGADTVIDYTKTKFETVVRDMDVVLDTVGGDYIDRSWTVLKKGGILVTAAGRGAPEKAQEHGVRTGGIAAVPTPEILKEIAGLIESGKVKPHVQKVFKLEEAVQAHTLSETGHGRGRIVLHVAD